MTDLEKLRKAVEETQQLNENIKPHIIKQKEVRKILRKLRKEHPDLSEDSREEMALRIFSSQSLYMDIK